MAVEYYWTFVQDEELQESIQADLNQEFHGS